MKRATTLLLITLLGACASTPPPPDWQTNAFAALRSATSAYLAGNTRLADLEFTRTRQEIARTGRADLLARAELARCAAQVASLELTPCPGYQALAADAHPSEQAYAAFLAGDWRGINPAHLPAQYRELVTQARDSSPASATTGTPPQAALSQIQEPLSRLIAAAVLLTRTSISPVDTALAVDTASSQGWRRPLLAWLGVQLKSAQNTGDMAAAERIQRRINLVLQTPTGQPG
ncbi:hypothetical protein [Rhodoferax sp.]|uniref:hypothetical protein n=1 Tax=Rhodoferax sp. TaxID=50421 RepID=UPI0026286F7E|nr:hypothetical protein [Rhodoferax sp.]MDD2925190.1 hypothetical protein [Rhodoferax sp.]